MPNYGAGCDNYRRYLCMVAALAWIPLFLCGRPIYGQSLTIDDICQGIEAHARQIEDIEVHYSLTRGTVEKQADGRFVFAPLSGAEVIASTRDATEALQAFDRTRNVWREKGLKGFLSRARIAPTAQASQSADEANVAVTVQFAWNGEIGKVYSISKDEEQGVGIVSAGPNGNLRSPQMTPLRYTNRMRDEGQESTISNLFRISGDRATVQPGFEEIAGTKCVVVIVRDHPVPGLWQKYWLAPGEGVFGVAV